MASFRIVRVDPSIWQRYRAVRLAALTESPQMFGSSYEREAAFDEAVWRERAQRPATFLIAHDETDVGTGGVYEFDAGWCVMGMWLHPDARGSGAVDALLQACIDTAREHRAIQVSLLVMADNPRGIRAYQRNGFAPTGAQEVAPDGRTELVMTRTLV